MKIYKFWAKVSGQLHIQGNSPAVSCWGGSNESIDDARTKALEKIAAVQTRIERRERFSKEDYEVEIREEVIEEINSRNIVTRTRYGALVLNSEDLLFIDIDEVPWSAGGFLKSLFSKQRLSKKEKMIKHVREQAQRSTHAGLQFRIYETSKGIRVIVTGRTFSPRSDETKQLFKDFNSDRLYARLCWKQNCFRARLTPKPSRAKCPTFKVIFPRSEEEQSAFASWLEAYESASQNFGVCRYVETIGLAGDNPIVKYHDQATKATKTLKLA